LSHHSRRTLRSLLLITSGILLVGQLSDTLDEFTVGAREKNELLQILGPMKSDVVGK
jgi:hypothetical protein